MDARIRAALRRLLSEPVSDAGFATTTLIMGGWVLVTWTAWVTGGLYSPSLYAQFVIVVLAEMCNGWRWGVATLLATTATIGVFAWAQAQGAIPPSLVAFTPQFFAGVVAIYLGVLFLLEAALSANMRTAHRRLSAELADRAQHEARLHQVIDNAPFGALVCELGADEELRISQSNHRATSVLRCDAQHVVGTTAEEAFPELIGTPLVAELRAIAEVGGVLDCTEEFDRFDGHALVLEMHCFRIASRTLGVFFNDVTEKRKAEKAIRHAAFHDDLTTLPNRKLLLERLASAFAGSRRRGNRVALLFIDLDDFKPINDELGHSFGDELLAAVARRLQSVSRISDTVARFGGDEFTVLLPDIETAEQAQRVATNLLEAFHEPFEIQGRHVTVTLSVGIALTSAEDLDPDSLIGQADMAMYQMKRAGRDGYRLWESPSLAPAASLAASETVDSPTRSHSSQTQSRQIGAR